jgi:hypothetical protein
LQNSFKDERTTIGVKNTMIVYMFECTECKFNLIANKVHFPRQKFSSHTYFDLSTYYQQQRDKEILLLKNDDKSKDSFKYDIIKDVITPPPSSTDEILDASKDAQPITIEGFQNLKDAKAKSLSS